MTPHKPDTGQDIGPELIRLRFRVDGRHHGWRLDQFIRARIPRLSRTRIQQMIRAQAGLGGAALRPSMRVQEDQEVVLLRPAPEEPDVPRTFEVLHLDPALLVIDKPAGLPVHATARYHRNTLTAVLRERFPEDVPPPSPAHRLDRETSGVMLVGRGPRAGARLKQAFRQRRVTKVYRALVHGRPPLHQRVELPLGPDLASGIRVKMGVTPGGQPAATELRRLACRGAYSLVEARPITGRQHQIRAHLGAIGFPVVGDKLYGPDPTCLLEFLETGWTEALAQRLLLPRQALHAAQITFPHPETGETQTVESPLPPELEQFWQSCNP